MDLTPTPYYEMNKMPRGLCLIVNNYDYGGVLPTIQNAQEAESEVRQTFADLFFDVETRTNLRASCLKSVAAEVASRDYTEAQCFVFYLKAHGDKGEVFGTDGKAVHFLELLFPFMNENPTLHGLPKVFILDLCGRKHVPSPGGVANNANTSRTNAGTVSNTERDGQKVEEATQLEAAAYELLKEQVPAPIEPDYVFAFATIAAAAENVSCALDTCLFTKTFCATLKQNCALLDLLQILNMMNSSLASAIVAQASEAFKAEEAEPELEKLGRTEEMDVAPMGDKSISSRTDENKNPKTIEPVIVLQECEIRSSLKRRLLMMSMPTASVPIDINDEKQNANIKANPDKVTVSEGLLCIGGSTTGSSLTAQSTCELFNMENNEWRGTSEMKFRRYEAAAVSFAGGVFVCGGLDETRKVLKSAERYDPKANAWSIQPSMLTPRNAHALVTVNRRLFAVGGENTRTIESIELITRKWEQVSELQELRRGLACVVTAKGLLVIGGRNEHGVVLSSCELFDTARKKWQAVGALNRERCFAAAVSWQKTVFVFGGQDNYFNCLDSVEQLDLSSNVWQTLESRLRLRRFGLSAAVVNNRIFIAGGRGEHKTLPIVEEFDAAANKVLYKFWSLSEAAYGLAVAAI